MRQILLILCGVLMGATAYSQNPATVFTIPNRTINLGCGTTCTTLTASVPHIKDPNSYVITRPTYLPYAYTTTTGTELTSIYIDDTYSAKITMPFSFCFYGINYPSLLVGSNSNITFDTSLAGGYDGWSIDPGAGIPNTDYDMASIFGPFHDINPSTTNNPVPTQRRIEWRIEGTAPQRRFIASFNVVAYYSASCNVNKATSMMVLYENTGIVEIYVKDKPSCTAWNDGMAILGMQDQTMTRAIAAPGKNATVWGSNNMDSAYRFIPSSGTSKFKRAELLINGNVVALGDTASGASGVLNLSWPNVCPTADSTAYVMRVVYGSCNTAQEVSFTDTIFVKKSSPVLNITKADANCLGNGTITVGVTGGQAPLQYNLNGGAYQSTGSFTNVAPGSYTVGVRDAANCTVTQQVTIGVINNLAINAGLDTTICRGASFTRNVTGTAGTTYSWSPSTGVSNPNIANPTLSPQNPVQYVITGTLGNCTATDILNVNVVSGAIVDAGPNASILAGDRYPMQASGSGGTYVWSPSTGLSSASILNPIASPQATQVYTLTVTSPSGCTASDNVTITVVPYCIKPMEAFTPNGDGINERWLITNGNCLQSARATVFNRYGAKVFESNDYKNTWDGTYEGKPLPDGTYYYVISFKLINGKTEHLKGNVTILR